MHQHRAAGDERDFHQFLATASGWRPEAWTEPGSRPYQVDNTVRYAQARAESVENRAAVISFKWKRDEGRQNVWRKSRIDIRHHIDRASALAGKLSGQVHLLKK